MTLWVRLHHHLSDVTIYEACLQPSLLTKVTCEYRHVTCGLVPPTLLKVTTNTMSESLVTVVVHLLSYSNKWFYRTQHVQCTTTCLCPVDWWCAINPLRPGGRLSQKNLNILTQGHKKESTLTFHIHSALIHSALMVCVQNYISFSFHSFWLLPGVVGQAPCARDKINIP